jgi:hypothetical protein
MENGPLRHFSETHLQLITTTERFEPLLEVALDVLACMPSGVSMVCGPMTSGGFGSLEKNLVHFERVIHILDARGEPVFTQLPFEAPMQRIKENVQYYQGDMQLLESFYLPIFKSGYITRLCFITNWESSYGTRWEHDRALELNLERRYFKENLESLAGHESLFLE